MPITYIMYVMVMTGIGHAAKAFRSDLGPKSDPCDSPGLRFPAFDRLITYLLYSEIPHTFNLAKSMPNTHAIEIKTLGTTPTI